MNLSDFNRYAEDLVVRKREVIAGGGFNPNFPSELLQTSPIIAALARESILAGKRGPIIVGSTSVENVEDTLV